MYKEWIPRTDREYYRRLVNIEDETGLEVKKKTIEVTNSKLEEKQSANPVQPNQNMPPSSNPNETSNQS